MLRFAAVVVLCAAGVLAPAASAVPAAAPSGAQLRVHAIFSGGARAPWHVGQVLDVQATGAPGLPGIARVCWDPAPIARPACDLHNDFAAPSATGTTTITATLQDGTVLTTRIRVAAARTRYDGVVSVPGVATCDPTRLYGSYDTRHLRFHAGLGAIAAGKRIARYNRVGRAAIFVWDYATDHSGFAKVGCVGAG
jgi:hypothetical protein